MRYPLRFQILVLFAGIMLGTLVAVSLVTALVAAQQREQEIERQVRSVAQTLLESSFPLTDAVLRQMRGLAGAEFILTDRAGHRRATSGPRAATLSPTGAASDGAGETSRQPIVEVAGEPYFHTAIALRRPATAVEEQWLHILYPERRWRDARRAAAYPPLIVGAGGMVLVSGLAMVVARRLSRPILLLEEGVGRLAKGDFAAIPLPPRNDELRDLVASVNSLAGQLDELSRAIRRSERLALLGQLAGGMAHQLRNGLTAAHMAVQLHQQRCDTHDRESLEMALRQMALLENQLHRFLAVGRPPELRRSRCSLGEVVREVTRLVEPTSRHRKVRLELVGAADEAVLEADAEQLRQLVLNLLVNAIEAADRGGWARIGVDEPCGGVVRLRVLDSGPGPPAELVAVLFEPFVTGKPEGVGLGLAVARQIAQAHGGTLSYDRSDGVTCFELELPVRSSLPGEPTAASTASASERTLGIRQA